MYLQAVSEQLIQKSSSSLIDYGLLGIFAVIMIVVIMYMEKQRNATILDMKDTIRNLTAKVDAQQKEQEQQQLNHVNFIKNEYKQSMEINRRCLEVLDDVKDLLKQSRIINP